MMVDDCVAFESEVELLNASWSLDEGRMFEVRICGESYGRVHPFKQYQQRRNGRMGTRFSCGLAANDQVIYQGQVMLASWKDASGNGQSVRFWMDEEADRHPLAGMKRRKGQDPGDVLFLALVELNDDETPIDQAKRQSAGSGVGASRAVTGGSEVSEGSRSDPVHSGGSKPAVRNQAAARGRGQRKLSSSAHLLVTSPLFVRFLAETKQNISREWNTEKARRYAKGLIKVESLSDLDRDREAAQRYENLIYKPYSRWYHQDPH